jgi:hypothetical protein
MAHTWKVAALDYAVSQDGLSNVVTTVHWTCSKEDENGNSGYAYGSHGLPEPDPSNFVAWDDLDEYTVISWCLADMIAKADEGAEDPVLAIQASVDAQIAEQAAPTSGSGVPW